MRRLTIITILSFILILSFSALANASWTVMVFLNADNNLERFGISDVNEMESVGSSSDVNIIVLMDRVDGYDTTNGNWKDAKRWRIVKDTNSSIMNTSGATNMGEIDMGDPQTVIDFVNWCKTNYPADHYMLDIWNHGAGLSYDKSFTEKGISFDDTDGNNLTTQDIGDILNTTGFIDVVGFDACLMQLPEINYECRGYVDYMVASEETEPGDGWEIYTFL